MKNGSNVIIWLLNIWALSVPGEGYSRNVSCALNLISMFLLLLHYLENVSQLICK